MSHKVRWEYFRAIYGGYQKGDRKTRQTILNEFHLNTGYHRKYAIRLLNGDRLGLRASPSRVRCRRAPHYRRKTLTPATSLLITSSTAYCQAESGSARFATGLG